MNSNLKLRAKLANLICTLKALGALDLAALEQLLNSDADLSTQSPELQSHLLSLNDEALVTLLDDLKPLPELLCSSSPLC